MTGPLLPANVVTVWIICVNAKAAMAYSRLQDATKVAYLHCVLLRSSCRLGDIISKGLAVKETIERKGSMSDAQV